MKEDCALWIKYYFIICSNNALNLDEEFWREKKPRIVIFKLFKLNVVSIELASLKPAKMNLNYQQKVKEKNQWHYL